VSERRSLDFAVITLTIARAEQTCPGDAEIGGTSIVWTTEDAIIAENLRDQLMVLLGDPARETLLPTVPLADVDGHMRPWPGSVTVRHREGL